MSPQKDPKERKAVQLKKLRDSPNVGRFAIVNYFNREVAKSAPDSKFPRLSAFLPNRLWQWVTSYLAYIGQSKFDFPAYTGGETGVFPISPAGGAAEIRIAIAGDWGTGTKEANQLAERMAGTEPDFTIHLGDVYYVGGTDEINENCLGVPTNGFDGVKFPLGSQGSFALNGNHEMYANGGPYFTTFLRTLGMGNRGQQASFFSLETESWRILAIDTGYNSVGWPILSMIPLINRIPAVGGDCHLEKKLIEWLRNTVKPKENPKATLILSHHEYYSKFKDHDYPKPAKQLMEFFEGQEVVWLWGHEHRLGIYDKFNLSGGITAYGRCIGHGGMPVETSGPVNSKKATLQLWDGNRTRDLDGTAVGINGYVRATIQGADVTLDYRDIDDVQLLTETFTAGDNGAIMRGPVMDPGILAKPG